MTPRLPPQASQPSPKIYNATAVHYSHVPSHKKTSNTPSTSTPNKRSHSVLYFFFFDERVPLIFHFSQLSGTFLAQKQHIWFQKLFLTSKSSCKECFVERKQIMSTTAAYSKLRISGGKTCFFLTCTRLNATDGDSTIVPTAGELARWSESLWEHNNDHDISLD